MESRGKTPPKLSAIRKAEQAPEPDAGMRRLHLCLWCMLFIWFFMLTIMLVAAVFAPAGETRYAVALSGLAFSVLASLLAAVTMHMLSRQLSALDAMFAGGRGRSGKGKDRGRIAPALKKRESLFTESAVALGGSAHNLIRRLMTINPADNRSRLAINECIGIVKQSPNLWDADRNTVQAALQRKLSHTKSPNPDAQDIETQRWLLSMLATQPEWNLKRQESHDVIRRRGSFGGGVLTESHIDIAPDTPPGERVGSMLDAIQEWDFDIFALGRATGGRALSFAYLELVRRLSLPSSVTPLSAEIIRFIGDIQEGYLDNPYHNKKHAADVTQSIGHFVSRPSMKKMLSPFEHLCLITAAAVHDYGHPGVNNGFLAATSDPIALQHNDQSPLERFHCAEAFKVLFQEAHDFTAEWSRADRRQFRSTIIELVLSTDLGIGMGFVNQFKLVKTDILAALDQGGGADSFELPVDGTGAGDGESKEPDTLGAKNRMLTMKVALRCADIGHPAKTFELHKMWTDRINDEFFAQGDREAALGLPISPLCDKSKFNLAKSQQGFITFVVNPCFKPFCSFAQGQQWMDNIQSNLQAWKDMAEQGKE